MYTVLTARLFNKNDVVSYRILSDVDSTSGLVGGRDVYYL